MKITVDRIDEASGDLVFIIRCSDATAVDFGEIEKQVMHKMDVCVNAVQQVAPPEHKLIEKVMQHMHYIKSQTFAKMKDKVCFDIKNTFEPRFLHITQEIYNWIYDRQNEPLKTWMQDFDPQRTKYYFNNDKTPESDFSEFSED